MPGLLLLFGVGAFVLMAIANNQSTTPPITPPFPTAPPRPKPPPSAPVTVPTRPVEQPPPPITLNPGGRYATPFERYALRDYFDPPVFDYAKLWFGRPASSFTQEGDVEKGIITEALTTKDGIYFRAPNHEMNTAEDFALLAHELVHARQFLDGSRKGTSIDEVPAYQTQVSVLRSLAPIAQLRSEFASQPKV